MKGSVTGIMQNGCQRSVQTDKKNVNHLDNVSVDKEQTILISLELISA